MKKPTPLFWLWTAFGLVVGVLVLFWFSEPLLAALRGLYRLWLDRERFIEFVASFGMAAPLVFMLLQVLQVILAPVPGEATGFIGGYLFGAFNGCLYSTLALGMGSWINFGIGRFLDKRWVRKVISEKKMIKYDYLLRHQGSLVVFFLFLIPGFPKDYLCLLLGISTMPIKLFLMMALIGRIPGTLLLSFQGALVFEKSYPIFFIVIAISLGVFFVSYRYREPLYRWIEKMNGRPADRIDDGGNQ